REVQATLVGRGVGPSLAFSPDGKKLATAGLDYVVQLWSMVTKEEVAAFRGHQGWIAALAFSPDGKTLASGSYDGSVKLWSTASAGTDLLRYAGDVGMLSPDGTRLYTANQDHMLRLWEMPARRLIGASKWNHPDLTAVAFSPDGHTVALSGIDDM